MSGKISGLVWDLDLPHAETFVLLAMADHADHEGNNVYPSIGLLAWKTGYSDRQVQRIITALRTRKILVAKDETPGQVIRYRIDLSQAPLKEPRERPSNGHYPRQNVTPDKMSPLTKRHPRQNVTGDIAMSGGGDIAMSGGGDIAMSPDPSVNRKFKRPIDPIAHASENGGSDRIGSVGSLNIPTGDDGGSVGREWTVLEMLKAIGLGARQAKNVLQKWPRTLGVSVEAWSVWIACHQHGEDGIDNAVAYAYAGLMAGNLPEQADDADELAAEQRKREDAAKAREAARFAKPPEPPPAIPIPENVVDPAEFRAALLAMREATMMPAPARPVNVYQTDGPDV